MTDIIAGLTPTTSADKSGSHCSATWAPTIANPADVTDADDTTESERNATTKRFGCDYQTIWTVDTGDADTVAAGFRALTSYTGDWTLEAADNPAGPWTEVDAWVPTEETSVGTKWEYVASFAEVEARYWRLVHHQRTVGTGGVGFIQGVELWTWELYAGEPPDPEPEPEEPNPDGYEAPEPARAIVEIFVDDPEGAKWGVAEWGEAVWPTAGWEPIDYLSIRCDVVTGTNQGDRGIIATPVAGTFTVDTFDPDRHLDPGNLDSPFAGQIVPGLPIRVNHRSVTLRTAKLTRAEYSLELQGGRLNAVDAIAEMANTNVPGDTDLSDTLFARARDAIEAAGIGIDVLADPGYGDPALASYTPPGAGDDVPVWDIVREAALEVLHTPYIDRDGRLGFRSWERGLERGRSLEAPALLDIVSWSSDDGLYSVVRVLDPDGTTVHERAATPTPRYGKRLYREREDTRTIDPETWAERVLADRREQTLRYRPGEVRPVTADDVEYYGTLEVLEGVDIIDTYTDPPIGEHARIMGSRLSVIDETKEPDQVRSRWRFTYTTSAAPPIPLVNDDDDDDILTTEDESEYLYAG